ncbi:hypothetical protein PGT21_034496 [Puccinia graminis f. sp. tritici]|uniref:Uncharacterized protein n=1 Tax=Puccinia graminis f. sp. tritici TaxID=56615 RepID=A0A5B0MPG6_PUCGR|nr:hypothetical protein PGT21_034496 [Puccinia graminis f. sp. tritici]
MLSEIPTFFETRFEAVHPVSSLEDCYKLKFGKEKQVADSQIRSPNVEWESFFQMDGRLWESAIQ